MHAAGEHVPANESKVWPNAAKIESSAAGVSLENPS
jgi:hypothetical protein